MYTGCIDTAAGMMACHLKAARGRTPTTEASPPLDNIQHSEIGLGPS